MGTEIVIPYWLVRLTTHLMAGVCSQFVDKGLAPASLLLLIIILLSLLLFIYLEVGTGKMYQYMDICVSPVSEIFCADNKGLG
jgi:hypothetical protein